jgi:hypothetical protein
MAEKRPVIHPFFTIKKRKESDTTETEESFDFSPSSDEMRDKVNATNDACVTVTDDQPDEEMPSSSANEQPEDDPPRCHLVCCSSSAKYVPTLVSDYQSTSTEDKRSCQESWFQTFSWLTFCMVCRCFFTR